MKNPMEIKTPVFKNQNRNPARLIGTAEGHVDAVEVVGVTSGREVVENVADASENKGEPKPKSGNMFSQLTLRGGAQFLVMGNSKDVYAAVQKVLGTPVQAVDGNGVGEETTTA